MSVTGDSLAKIQPRYSAILMAAGRTILFQTGRARKRAEPGDKFMAEILPARIHDPTVQTLGQSYSTGLKFTPLGKE